MTQAHSGSIIKQDNMTEQEQVEACINALLEAKGFFDAQAKKEFLYPINGLMHDPFLFRDMMLVCEIIEQAMLKQEKILIFGDYDCDGLTATAIMVRGLREIYPHVTYFVPNRLEDGYGLSCKSLVQVFEQKPDLVITVDCGINSFAEIQQMMEQGIKVIVTDHHQPDEGFSRNALAVVNPQVQAESYPFQGLAGAGVAYKVIEAMYWHLGIEKADLTYAKCLAAVGTVSDSMPLEDENRVLVAFATSVFREKAPLGLRLMTEKLTSSLNSSHLIEASFFGFSIGPRLNAAGRMGNIEPALTLLLSDDRDDIEVALAELEELNNQRKLLEQGIFQEAVAQIEAMDPEYRKNIIIVSNKDWHSGITGIVSSRLMERYSLPVITFAGSDGVETDSELKGSARSMANFDILAAIQGASEYTETFGGHLQAAGVTVREEQFADFKREVLHYAAGNPLKKSELEDLQYQFDLPHELINDQLADRIMQFEPFGQKNEKPAFLIRNLQIAQWRAVGNGRHVSLMLRLSDDRLISAIAFNFSRFAALFRQNDRIDLLAAINRKEWNGRVSTQLEVLDLRAAALDSMIWDDASRIEESYQIENNQVRKLVNMYGIDRKQLMVHKRQIFHVLEYFSEHLEDLEKGFNCTIVARAIVREKKIFLNPFILARILDILSEIGELSVEPIDKDNLTLLFLKPELQKSDIPVSTVNAENVTLAIHQSETWQNLEHQGLTVN